MFWSLMIAFGVLWAIAVAIEVIWFWELPEEVAEDTEPGPANSKPIERTDPSQKGGDLEGGLETKAS